jgi:hypothetical protein
MILKGPVYFRNNDIESGAYPAGYVKDIASKYNTNHVFGHTIKLLQSSITEWSQCIALYDKQQVSKLLGATSVEHSLNKKTDYIDTPAK